MELYSSNKDYKLYHGNMLDMLEVIEPNSIDSIITDPPYGLTSTVKRFGKEDSAEVKDTKGGFFKRLDKGFMGKEWDGSGIEYNVDAWRKCYEVLKPGGYLLAFGGSRTFHRIACAIEDAGFEIRDTIMYLYGSGFPKSQNIGKQLEKRYEDEKTKQKTEHDLLRMWERNIQKTKSNEKEQENILFNKLQEQSMEKSSNTTSNVWGEEPCLERWNNIQKTERELQWCQICEMSKRVFINGEERWICNGTQNCNGEALREMFDKNGSCPSYRPQPEQQFNRELNAIQEQWGTQACREVIENWKKIGTALKPSFEPIIVARKPFKGSLVDNVIEYGVGGINIDECRVETTDINRKGGATTNGNLGWKPSKKTYNDGRFPANTILTFDETDLDEVCGGFPNTNGGKRHNTAIRKSDKNSGYGFDINTRNEFNDSGSASRYFYCAKASKKDRDEGLDSLEIKKTGELQGGRKEGSAGSIMLNADGTTRVNPYAGIGTPKRNNHPTVKPTELMQYLIRLVTPKGGVILDPFNGSGSTGKAVMYENKERNKNYKYIGIELTEEYLPISKARIECLVDSTEKNQEEPKENITEGQTNIFDFIKEGE